MRRPTAACFRHRTAAAAAFACLVVFGHAPEAGAQTTGSAAPQASGTTEKPPSVYERIWKLTELYRSDDNRILQQLRFSGRFQQDYATVDADEGNASEWNVRRMRLGLRATIFRTLTLHGEADLNPQEADPFYLRLTDMYLAWNAHQRAVLTVGKQAVPFTLDGSTSSKDLLTIDRSNLANNLWFPTEYLTGVSVSGTAAPWVYRTGVYSAGRENREFGDFTGSAATLASLGYDFAKTAGAKEGLLSLNYVYQSPHRNNTSTRSLQHVASANLRFEKSRWGLRTDLSAANGYYSQSDLWGVVAMPYVNATRSLQLVGRYTFVTSENPNGLRLATYENRVVAERGDRFHELYAGANYYFYGQRLKLQTGVQSGSMRDRAGDGGAYSGVSWTTGLRVGW